MFTLQPTVVSKSSNPGLSLLSRGIGEEKRQSGHRKLEVSLEPEDYHNIQGRRFYLPPLQQQAWPSEKQMSPREIRAHKTYTTRKGALLLYAEDLAQTSKNGGDRGNSRSLEAEDSTYFNSISDLRNAVLSYGSSVGGHYQPDQSVQQQQQQQEQQPFLGFVHNKRRRGPLRSVRPGFSAKRYLANWSRSWDDSILNYLRSEGHIWDKNLFQQNVLAPNLYRRINDDLSLVPLPYRVTRNMLVSPGEFESLEFYRIRPDVDLGEEDETEEGYEGDLDGVDDSGGQRPKVKKRKSSTKPFNVQGSIAMIVRDMEQKPHAVQYQNLEEDQQREVLQRLLLQSALHQHQHLRQLREKKEQERIEAEEGMNGRGQSEGEAGKLPRIAQSGQDPREQRTSTSMTQHGSINLVIPDAKEVDMEQAISNLITSNSTNILGGSMAFTDQTILDLYKASKEGTRMPAPPPSTSPSQWPQGAAKRRVKTNMYHTYPANFAGIQPLPPIQNSLEGSLGGGGDSLWPIPPSKANGGPPVITMEPPTPQHPKLSVGSRRSKLSVGWSSRKTVSNGSVQSSSESNIWKVDIDENDLMQQAAADEVDQERAASDQEVWTKSPRSSQKGSDKMSAKHSVHSYGSKGSGKSGPALSINNHISRSLDNIEGADEQNTQFPTGRSIPSRFKESMRSYKGSAKNSDAGSLFGGGEDGGEFMITGSKRGSTYAPSLGSQADRVPSPIAPSHTTEQSTSEKWGVLEPVVAEEPAAEEIPPTEPPLVAEIETKSQTAADDDKSIIESTANLAGSTDDGHSVVTDEFPSPEVGEEGEVTEGGQEGVGKPLLLGQGVIDLPLSDPPAVESVRDRMSERRSLPRSKKSSSQGSLKSESLRSEKDPGDIDAMPSFQNFSYLWKQKANARLSKGSKDGDLDELSDHEAEEEEWPLQTDQSKAASEKAPSEAGEHDEQLADGAVRKSGSVAGSESEVEVEVTGDMEDGEGEGAGAAQEEEEEQVDDKTASRTSSLLEPPGPVTGRSSARSRASTMESQLEQLVEAAAVVVEQIMQRPKSGRDLAEDAQLAAQLWSTKLGELFDDDENDPERVRSAPYRRRRNSLDNDSVTSSMLEEQLESDRATPMSNKRMKKIRRIHSAEAAISLLRHLLKSAKSAKSDTKDALGPGGDGAPDDGTLGFGVTNIGVAEKLEAEKEAVLVRAPPEEPVTAPPAVDDATLNDELAKIVQETGLLEKKGAKSKKGSSTKSSTKASTKASTKSSKKSSNGKDEAGEEKEKEVFIVGMPKESKADIMLYKPMTPEPKKEEPKAPPKEKKKIQKKIKKAPPKEKPKKTKKAAKPQPPKAPKDAKTEEEKEEDAKSKAASEKKDGEEEKAEGESKEEEEKKEEEGEKGEEEEEEEESIGRASPESPEFIFIKDEFSESEDEEPAAQLPDPDYKLEPTVSAAPSEDFSEITDFTEDSTSQGPNSISRSQAKAFKRAAEAEKRKAAVEKKRRERDEAKKKALEEAERAERIKLEYEEEKRRKEQDAKDRLEKAALDRERMARDEAERQRQAALAAEKERRQQAEFKRKMEEMARRKREEDAKRKAEEEQRRKEEEERQRIEAEMLAEMEEAERLEYEKRRQAEELEAARIAEEERIKREIEEKIAEEKARLLAIEMAKRQKEIEARLQFNKDLHSEANIFSHSQDMTRAFTWSYFELLDHLGIEIPDSLKEHFKEVAESKGE